MTFNYAIVDTDNEPADPMDIVDIQECPCNNCGRMYNGHAYVVFVRISIDKLIWWHKFRCDHHKKQDEKKTNHY